VYYFAVNSNLIPSVSPLATPKSKRWAERRETGAHFPAPPALLHIRK